jgi:predicted metal-dependent HD superfamily phosphohydrolase
VVYDPTRRDNAARSAAAAAKVAGEFGLPADWIAACILATCHSDPPETADQRLIADIDLSILAAAPEEYDRYCRAIRAENRFASDSDYCVGRAQFLRKILERPHLFHTERYRAVAEEAARTNIRRELAELDSRAAPA